MTETELDELRAEWFQKGWTAALKEIILLIEAGQDVEVFARTQVEHLTR